MPDDVLDLLSRKAEVDRHKHSSTATDAEQRGQQPRRVLADDGHPFTHADSHAVEHCGLCPGALRHLRVGDGSPRLRWLDRLVDDGLTTRVDLLGASKEVVDSECDLHGTNCCRLRDHRWYGETSGQWTQGIARPAAARRYPQCSTWLNIPARPGHRGAGDANRLLALPALTPSHRPSPSTPTRTSRRPSSRSACQQRSTWVWRQRASPRRSRSRPRPSLSPSPGATSADGPRRVPARRSPSVCRCSPG